MSSNTKLEAFVGIDPLQWQHNHCSFILQVRLETPEEADDSSSAKRSRSYTLLTEIAAELEKDGSPLKLSFDLWDRAILEKVGFVEDQAFSFLVQSHTRCSNLKVKLWETLRLAKESESQQIDAIQALVNQRNAWLDSLAGMLVSHSGLLLSEDYASLYYKSPNGAHQGAEVFASLYFSDGLTKDYIEAFSTRFSADEVEIMEMVVRALLVHLRNGTLKASLTNTGSYLPCVDSFSKMLDDKVFNATLVKLDDLMNPPFATAQTLELLSFLGPFLGRFGLFLRADEPLDAAVESFPSNDLYSLQPSIGRELDGIGVGQRNLETVRSTQQGFRMTYQFIFQRVFDSVMKIVRINEGGKSCILGYFRRIAELNKARIKLHFDKRQTGSDSFLWGASILALKLCQPFLDSQYSKLHLIDIAFPFTSPEAFALVEDGTTRMCMASSEAVRDYYQTQKGRGNGANFVTNMFYSTLELFHIGPCSIIRFYTDFTGELRKKLQKFNSMAEQYPGGHFPNSVMSNQFRAWQAQLDGMVALKLAMETHVFDETMLDQFMQFTNFSVLHLVKVIFEAFSLKIDNAQYKDVARGILVEGLDIADLLSDESVGQPVPEIWAALPEWMLENVIEMYLFICRFKPTLFKMISRDEFATFAMIILVNPRLIKNFYLKSKVVEVIFHFTIPLYQTPQGVPMGALDEIFRSHPLARVYLVPALLRFYVDAEQTGLSSQFYDKFNIRFHISKIIQCVWNNPKHRQQIVEQSRASKHFIRFVNLLMTDTTFLLDESLSKLTEIHSLQNEMRSVEYQSKPQRYKDEKTGQLELVERQADGYMSLGNETVHMLNYMTAESRILDAFMASEIVERLAAMLDYNLCTLVGPKSLELKVKNPEKYRFNPKRLLTEIVGIYLHLSSRREFVESVAKDGRSYNKEIFAKAAQILGRTNLCSAEDIEKLMLFVESVEQCIKNAHQQEEDLGDVPEEFLDPLMCTLMVDPVILPSSGTRVDRSTIVTHLLSDSHDPFNRVPLTLEQVQPDVELFARINSWKAEKMSKTGTK